jgi:hypothetical protein
MGETTTTTLFNIQDTNVHDLTDSELQTLLNSKGTLAKKVAKKEIARRQNLNTTKSSTGSQDFRKGGMVLSTVDRRKTK